MNHTVYFADQTVLFATAAPDSSWHVVTAADDGISRDKVVKNLEKHNTVVVVSVDPDAIFARFAADFTAVEAAGGVVVNACGDWLLIHRNGRWDLPKGHLEAGETLAECAAREICEETGVAAEVVRPLCDTQHAYYFPKTARWELKTTHWFSLRTASCDPLTPQTEEGIETAGWYSPATAEKHLLTAFPTVRCVVAKMK